VTRVGISQGSQAKLRNAAEADPVVFEAVLSGRDFSKLSSFILDQCGIRLPLSKKQMLEGRLRRRLRTLGFNSFDRYMEYLLGPEGEKNAEFIHLIDEVTTNKTDFFRESKHFELLTKSVLPELIDTHGLGVRTKLNVWSAGCSTGEEPYTIAMVLSEFAETVPAYHFSVLATDISTKVLEKAAKAIYESAQVEVIPMQLKKKYLLKSKERNRNLVRVTPALRALVRFQRLNLLERAFAIGQPMGVVFCRNVLIYFDRATQEAVLKNICRYMTTGGYLFTGHSETLHNMDLPLEQCDSTVYRRL
jgi:chemotaxis protein methyltransferase CheR